MKRILKILIAVFTALIIGTAAVSALLRFCHPMENTSYNLSMFAPDGEDTAYDKGWTVFIDNAGDKKALIPDGTGGFSGLDYPGQTFYFSRGLQETLDDPTISIGVANRTVSVFLDDTLIYTDCPEMDNRIGYLNLPMLEYDRTERVIVSLPPDCQGKTLTIAQSSDVYSDKQEISHKVYPSEVTLYCGYAYESGLIADASKTSIPAAVLFTVGILLLIAFIWYAVQGNFLISLPVIAMALFFEMCGVLAKAPFFYKYFGGSFHLDWSVLFFHLSVGALLVYLSVRAVRFRWIMITASAVQLMSVLISVLVQYDLLMEYSQMYVNLIFLPDAISFLALLAALIYSFFMSKNDSAFHKYMSHVALGVIICYAVFVLLSFTFVPSYILSVAERTVSEAKRLMPKYTLNLLWGICLVSSIAALMTEILQKEIADRTAAKILTVKSKLAMESYENLKQQYEEIQIIRHDTAKHYAALRTMLDKTPERIQAYLDNLIGQLDEVRPVVESGNEVLDILINGKLSAARDKRIHIDITHLAAPKELPLSDVELCSLIINILDNALNAVSTPDISNPFIKLNLQCKNNYFVFSCENSVAPNQNEHKNISVGENGYGLKIINQIMKKYGDMVSVGSTDNSFKISIAFLLI